MTGFGLIMYESTYYRNRKGLWTAKVKWTVWDGDTPGSESWQATPSAGISGVMEQVKSLTKMLEKQDTQCRRKLMEDIVQMLDDCDSVKDIDAAHGGPGFNDWEKERLDDYREYFERNSYLTEKQLNILKGLWNRF